MSKHWLWAMAAMVLLWLSATFGPWPEPSEPNPQPFTPRAWSTASRTKRRAMADDLLARHLTAGMTQARVIELLGKPDATTQHDRDDHAITYSLGHDDQLIDESFYWLRLWFDGGIYRGGRVEKTASWPGRD